MKAATRWNTVSLAAIATVLSLSACGGSTTEGGTSDTAASKGATHPLLGSSGPAFAVDPVMNAPGKVALKNYSGKVVVVDFWATWCEPCKKSFPKLQALNVKYRSSGVEIVGISEDDDRDGLADFGATYGAKFAIAWDKDKGVAAKWQPKSMPSTFVVDRSGIVRYVHVGYHDGEEAEIDREIKSLL